MRTKKEENVRQRYYYHKNIKAKRKWRNKYVAKLRDHHRKMDKIRRHKLREEVISAYGEACACCGEHQIEFLAMDHINNDGKEHRKVVPPSEFYPWLKRNNYPKGYQVLCNNCNLAKARYGICPHKKARSTS